METASAASGLLNRPRNHGEYLDLSSARSALCRPAHSRLHMRCGDLSSAVFDRQRTTYPTPQRAFGRGVVGSAVEEHNQHSVRESVSTNPHSCGCMNIVL